MDIQDSFWSFDNCQTLELADFKQSVVYTRSFLKVLFEECHSKFLRWCFVVFCNMSTDCNMVICTSICTKTECLNLEGTLADVSVKDSKVESFCTVTLVKCDQVCGICVSEISLRMIWTSSSNENLRTLPWNYRASKPAMSVEREMCAWISKAYHHLCHR